MTPRLSLENARGWYTEDPTHGFEHVLIVLRLAEMIARQEGADLEVVRAAVLLHDATPPNATGSLAGDQHLGSTIQYGVEDWGDSAFALCVPSVSNYFPRRWFPQDGPVDHKPGAPRNLGRFVDGFGNKMTVLAVANPYPSGLEPPFLYDRAAGYGIVKLNRETREIEYANWPRQVDPKQPEAKPYEGWPVKFKQMDNYAKQPAAYLPALEISGRPDPVVQVIDEESQEVIYTLRIRGNSFRPPVFKKGLFTIVVGEGESRKTLSKVEAKSLDESRVIQVEGLTN